MLKLLIVDDELHAREALKEMVKMYCRDVEIVDLQDNIISAYDSILTHSPNLVLLDVTMPPNDGFQLLKMFNKVDFEVIFTTAYNTYAINAFKVSAIDYLLKPVDPMELRLAIDKAINTIALKNKANLNHTERLILNTDRSYIFVSIADILRIEADNRNLVFHMIDAKKHTITKNISEYEDILEKHGFFRSHRGHIINLRFIKEYIPDRSGGCVIMQDDKLVPVAARRKEQFLQVFK